MKSISSRKMSARDQTLSQYPPKLPLPSTEMQLSDIGILKGYVDALSAVLTYRRCIFLGTRQSAFHLPVPEDHSSAISMAVPSSGPL
jgi:hypothetical protein